MNTRMVDIKWPSGKVEAYPFDEVEYPTRYGPLPVLMPPEIAGWKIRNTGTEWIAIADEDYVNEDS
ncbi:hypothetical protein EVB95_062 [Rhizobium phage RHph_TM2_3B]|nr:hypothetical protein EVB95_062 [Rhizobium phage RHph_TM2_3B]